MSGDIGDIDEFNGNAYDTDNNNNDLDNTTTEPLIITFVEYFNSPLFDDQQISISANQEIHNCIFKIYGSRFEEFIAIKDDLTKYRQLRHRMKSLMATFGMKELLKLLDQIKATLMKGPLSLKEKKAFTTSLDYHIKFLIDSLTNKLSSLKWQ